MENSHLHKIAAFGAPGTGKSLLGLSYKVVKGGVEQHIFGSSEEATSLNFKDQSGILEPYKKDWTKFLTKDEEAEINQEPKPGKEFEKEKKITSIRSYAQARSIIAYKRYLLKLKRRIQEGDPKAPGAIFLDNGSSFASDFEDYVRLVFAEEFETSQGNFDKIKYSMRFAKELIAFFRDLYTMPCHVIVSFHVKMTMDEETAATANIVRDAKAGIKYPKEWLPLITGQAKYSLASIPNHALFMFVEESHGQKPRYLAKIIADDKNIGVGKPRFNPWEKSAEHKGGSKIMIPKGTFYQFMEDALRVVN